MMGENNTRISFPNTAIYMGFKFDDDMKEEPAYKNLQEFVSYICNKDFENPRLSVMSDLHRHFPHPLDIKAGGLDILKVIVTPEEEEEEEKDMEDGELGTSHFGKDRTGYILTPKHEDSSFKYGWILVVFNATSVTQIIRNGWGSWSMETLVRHLVRHGVEFRTLVPAAGVKHSSERRITYTLKVPSMPRTSPLRNGLGEKTGRTPNSISPMKIIVKFFWKEACLCSIDFWVCT